MLTALAHRVGSHPRRSLLLVLLLAVVGGAFGGPVAGVLDDSGGFTPADSGSARAEERLAAASGKEPSPGVVLRVATPEGAAAPAARERVAALEAELRAVPGVAEVAGGTSGPPDPDLVARDGTAAYLAATLSARADGDLVTVALMETFADRDGVAVGGNRVAEEQIGARVGEDLGRAELFAFPILLLLSLLFFRGRATVLPLVVGVVSILTTFLVLLAVNEVYGLSIFALNLVIGLGLGLAIDATLFLVTRYREELDRRGPGPEAIVATMTTAGRTVVFSAATVAISLSTLTLFPLGFLQSMGIAGAIVAVVAAGVALVVCPAFFALWGTKLAVRRRRERPTERGSWYRLSHAVMRRPATVAIATTLVMLVVSLPALRAEFTPVDASVIPKAESARTVADAVARELPGQGTSPVGIAISAPRDDAAAVARYAERVSELPGVVRVAEPRPLDEGTWQLDVAASGEPEGAAARGIVERLRADRDGPDVLVGGVAAEFVDQQAGIASRIPIALALLCGLTFTVLWLMTGSVILPLKALIANALTVGASLGVLTLIYQDGRFEGFLNYTSNGGVEPTDFLVAAALVFALSTDYGVFLLGRIKEARDAGLGERESVAVGLERTGAVVTAAAILLAVAIGAFATSSISFIQQIGVATAVGVLFDAFVVRALLVPALMALLGRWNWWSPMWLRRVHDRVGIREEPAADATPDRRVLEPA